MKGGAEFSLLALFQENILLMDPHWPLEKWFDSREFLKENVAQHAFDGAKGHNTKMVDAPTMLKTVEHC